MKLLHTSDWHLGKTWNGLARDEEFAEFTDWLLGILETEKVDVLFLAGDVFDSVAPPVRAQKLYFSFLLRTSRICRKVVVIAGNHDSAPLLDVPREVFLETGIHVVGTAGRGDELVDKELVVLWKNDCPDTEPEMMIAAVPFLREGDLRWSTEGESAELKEEKSLLGLRRHYEDICREALKLRGSRDIPLVAGGHLFVQGGTASEGVREIRVGNLSQIDNASFPTEIDYLALGHLHVPQLVAKQENRRYSGSPLPMSFDEAGQEKVVLLVEFEGKIPAVKPIPVPVFTHVRRVIGTLPQIEEQLRAVKDSVQKTPKRTVLEVVYNGSDSIGDLQKHVEDVLEIAGEEVPLIFVARCRNEQIVLQYKLKTAPGKTLKDLDELDVFRQLLETRTNVPEDDPGGEILLTAYTEIVGQLDSI